MKTLKKSWILFLELVFNLYECRAWIEFGHWDWSSSGPYILGLQRQLQSHGWLDFRSQERNHQCWTCTVSFTFYWKVIRQVLTCRKCRWFQSLAQHCWCLRRTRLAWPGILPRRSVYLCMTLWSWCLCRHTPYPLVFSVIKGRLMEINGG